MWILKSKKSKICIFRELKKTSNCSKNEQKQRTGREKKAAKTAICDTTIAATDNRKAKNEPQPNRSIFTEAGKSPIICANAAGSTARSKQTNHFIGASIR